MQDIITELTRCQDNQILDHLLWHISQGRLPSSIEAHPVNSVVVIGFKAGEQWQHEIEPGWFIDYWEDARAVVAAILELPQMAELQHAACTQLLLERKKCAIDIKRWKEACRANG